MDDRKRNSSSNQGGFKHARTRFLSHAPGERVGRLPAHALHPPRKAHDTWHSAPNHMEPPSAAPRPGLRDACCHPCLCKCVMYVGCVSVPRDEWDRIPDIIASAWSHLSHLTPNTNVRGGGTDNHSSSLACVVLEGHGRHGCGHQIASTGLLLPAGALVYSDGLTGHSNCFCS